jgi:hypothetical protein
MNTLAALKRSRLLVPSILLALVPLSFNWSSRGGFEMFFFPDHPKIAMLLWAASATLLLVVVLRPRAARLSMLPPKAKQ